MNMNRCIGASAIAVLMLNLLLWSRGGDAATEERWYVLNIDGTTVGSVHETESRAGTGWISTEESRIALNRMGSRLEIRNFQKSVEDDAGRLQSIRQETKTSGRNRVVRGRRENGEWVRLDGDDARAPQRRWPIEGELLGPHGVRAVLVGLQSPGDVVEYRAFIPHLGRPGGVRAELKGFESFGGRRLRVVAEIMPGLPTPLTRLIDEAGYGVVVRMPGPFGLTETVLADEAAARLANDGGSLGEEVFRSTLVETGVRLPHPRSIEYLEVELRHRNPALGWPEFDSAHQTVLEQSPERLVLAIHRRHPRQEESLQSHRSEHIESYLSSNALLKTDQPELVELARKITSQEPDAWRAALELERWVAENMKFDMGVVLAPSDEVLADRRGTCSEYAILLTALARAAGIPARYVGGYVYAHGMFGGHAWTEVRIGDQWLALDAAIPAEGPADAARIAFLWTGLDDGAGELNSGAALQVYGQIDGRVLAWRTTGGRERRYPDGAPAPEVVDGRFIDRIQGIEWSVPDGWRIVDYTDTWPSNRIAAAEDQQGRRIEFLRVAASPWETPGEALMSTFRSGPDVAPAGEPFEWRNRRAWYVEHEGQSAMAIAGRNGFWVLGGEGREVIRSLASGLMLPSP